MTMPSGERIQFGTNVNFLFETDSLQYASPATVSRMGMIFISGDALSPNQFVEQWLKGMSEDDREEMKGWIHKHFERYCTSF